MAWNHNQGIRMPMILPTILYYFMGETKNQRLFDSSYPGHEQICRKHPTPSHFYILIYMFYIYIFIPIIFGKNIEVVMTIDSRTGISAIFKSTQPKVKRSMFNILKV